METQRELLEEMNRAAELDEELIRKYLSLIDLEEYIIRERRVGEPDPEIDPESSQAY
ncbi:MAG TPA: hypothetical protein VHH35_16985 [Pyrinomonadaceae bacterium]|nr:hypothetical protein [Pyrinomonadaceae bacterium]